MLIEEEYRLVFYAHHEFGELYHHREDPDLMVNLWNDPTQQQRKHDMIGRLLSHEMNKSRPCPKLTDVYQAGGR